MPKPKPKTHAHAEAVAETIAAFQPYYKEPITEAGAEAMVKNLGDVLLMLAAWRDEDVARAASGTPGDAEPRPPAVATSPGPAPTRRKRPRRFPPDPL